ncbi:hypothetical protein F5B21DRAFT_493781 [Xylaria acuta]|nr:hypothetical protein F5B21DRAFT_493781 [Xylaria acuta]
MNGWLVWIDALCINQQDIVERATKARRMRDIYSKDFTPLVWLSLTARLQPKSTVYYQTP